MGPNAFRRGPERREVQVGERGPPSLVPGVGGAPDDEREVLLLELLRLLLTLHHDLRSERAAARSA